MDNDDIFELDYNEDFPGTSVDKVMCEDLDEDALLNINEERLGYSLTNLSAVSELSVGSNKDVAVDVDGDDDDLEGDGMLSDDEFYEKDFKLWNNCVNGQRKSSEEELTEAIKARNWDALVSMFGPSLEPTVREQLCFMCSDLLSSPAEFLGITKCFQNKCNDVKDIALIGSKLLVNADLCSNYRAGAMIVRILTDANVQFHNFNIKTFPATDAVKAAIKCCIQESSWDNLLQLVKKSSLFTYNLTGSLWKLNKDKSHVVFRILSLCEFVQLTVRSLASQDELSDVQLELASCCLDGLVTLYVAKYADSTPKDDRFPEAFKDMPDAVWLLTKIFMARTKASKVFTLVRLAARYKDLITWSSYDYKAVVAFFNSLRFSKYLFDAAILFMTTLTNEGKVALPLFKKYSKEDCAFIKIYSSMSQEEMQLYVSMFAASASEHLSKTSRIVMWNIFLIHKSLTSMEYNHAIDKLKIALKRCGLTCQYTYKSFVVRQYFKNIRPLLSMKVHLPAHRIRRAQASLIGELDPLANGSVSIPESKASAAAAWDADDSMSIPELPTAIANHPRFAKKPKQDLDEVKDIAAPVPENSAAEHSHPCEEESKVACDVFKRLRQDVEARLTFFVNSNKMSPLVAKCLLAPLSEKLYGRLPKDAASGRPAYDDDAFEESQHFLNAHVMAMLRKHM